MHIASKIGRPTVLLHGDDQLGTSDLVGGEHGYRYRRLVDNFISRVLKTEESMDKRWTDNRLTIACKNGHTLIYDEFTRSRPGSEQHSAFYLAGESNGSSGQS